MAKKIHPSNLRKYLWRRGPYVHFYNGNCGGINAFNVQYLNSLANSHKFLQIFQIDWEDQLKFNPLESPTKMNSICVHYEGEIKYTIFNPTTKDLDILFSKCIELYNEKQDTEARNIGTKGKRQFSRDKDFPMPTYDDDSPKRREKKIEWSRKRILRKKIIIEEIKNSEKDVIPYNFFKESQNCNNIYKFPKNTNTEDFIKIFKNEKETFFLDSQESKWFHDVGIKDLPLDFIDENPIQEPININKKLNCRKSDCKIRLLPKSKNKNTPFDQIKKVSYRMNEFKNIGNKIIIKPPPITEENRIRSKIHKTSYFKFS